MKRRHWIEAACAALAAGLVLAFSIPGFLNRQRSAQVARLEEILDRMAHVYAGADNLQALLQKHSTDSFFRDRAISLWAEGAVQSEIMRLRRYRLDYERVRRDIDGLPEIDMEEPPAILADLFLEPRNETDAEFAADPVLFAVYAWVAADEPFTRIYFMNGELALRPSLDGRGAFMMEPLAPIYGARNGWGERGIVYRDSYQAGWRKQPHEWPQWAGTAGP
ncbi:MAG: hypothetical protein GC154_12040 [bacterium]|nr:hypothetical protein [bacterium]